MAFRPPALSQADADARYMRFMGGYLSGDHYPIETVSGDGTLVMTINLLSYAAFYVRRPTTFDRIALEITTIGAAGSIVRLGVYQDNGTYRPGTLLVDAGTIDSTVLGVSELVILQVLPSGTVWLAAVAQVAVPTCRSRFSNILSPTGENPAGNANVDAWDDTGVIAGALPATASPTRSQTARPKLYLRAQ